MRYGLIFLILCFVVPLFGETKYAVMETRYGDVLYSRNMNAKGPMASTTKIMTALIYLEKGNKKNIVYTKKAYQMPTKNMFFRQGSVLTYKNALMGMLIASSNDLAYSVAENYGYDEFIYLMNKKAESLGMKNTHFVNPHGLDERGHYSSAYDMCLLGKYAMKNSEFRDLIKPQWTVTAWKGERKYQKRAESTFKDLYKIPELRGIKTGTTTRAKHCFVGYFDIDGVSVVTCVLGSGNALQETKELFEYTKKNCVNKKVLDREYILSVCKEKVPVIIEKPVFVFCDKKSQISHRFVIRSKPPMRKNTKIGEVIVYKNKKQITKCDVICNKTIIMAKKDFVISLILILLLCGVVYYNRDYLLSELKGIE